MDTTLVRMPVRVCPMPARVPQALHTATELGNLVLHQGIMATATTLTRAILVVWHYHLTHTPDILGHTITR